MLLPQSSLNPICTYPDVLLYILSFPCCRVARILKRFVTRHERIDALVSVVPCLPAHLCVSPQRPVAGPPRERVSPSPRQARWHDFLSDFDLRSVYTPGPVNPAGDFLSRWAYPANPALGDVSIHGTAQAARDVRSMMAAEEEELLARPLVFQGGCGARC